LDRGHGDIRTEAQGRILPEGRTYADRIGQGEGMTRGRRDKNPNKKRKRATDVVKGCERRK